MGWQGRRGGLLPGETYATLDVVVGGQPDERQLEAMAAAGYRMVLDTRQPGEARGFDEPALVARLGMKYVNLPIVGSDIPDESFDRLRDLLAGGAGGPSGGGAQRPAVLHCASGNRVSALLIPWLILDEGATVEQALRVAADAGLRNGQLARLALDYVRRKGGDALGGEASFG